MPALDVRGIIATFSKHSYTKHATTLPDNQNSALAHRLHFTFDWFRLLTLLRIKTVNKCVLVIH